MVKDFTFKQVAGVSCCNCSGSRTEMSISQDKMEDNRLFLGRYPYYYTMTRSDTPRWKKVIVTLTKSLHQNEDE